VGRYYIGLGRHSRLPQGYGLPTSVVINELLLFEKWDVLFVTSVFHLFDGNEMERSGINDVSSEGGRIWVGKDMAKARITSLVANLGPLHLVCVVGDLDKEIVRNGFGERGQADFAVEFVNGSKQWFAGNDIDVDADFLAVPKLILKRCLRAVSTNHVPFLGL
jgi:hypothetical protein